MAETLPDYRDETWDVETSLVDGHSEDRDAYSDLLVQKSNATFRMSGLPYAVSSQFRLPLLAVEDGR